MTYLQEIVLFTSCEKYAQTGNETKCCYECASLSFIWGHSFSAHKIFQKSNISSSFLENFA